MMLANGANFVEKDGKVKMLRPAVLTCGCGQVTSRLGSILQYTRFRSNQLDQIKIKSNALARRWCEEMGLYETCPLLKQHVFGIFVTPKGEWFDINRGTSMSVAERMQQAYDEYSNHK